MSSQTLQLFDSLVLLAVRYAIADTGSASFAQVQQAMAYLQPPGAEPDEISTALQRLQSACLITGCDQQYQFNELAERFWQQSGADKVCGVRVQWQRLHQQLHGFELGSQEVL